MEKPILNEGGTCQLGLNCEADDNALNVCVCACMCVNTVHSFVTTCEYGCSEMAFSKQQSGVKLAVFLVSGCSECTSGVKKAMLKNPPPGTLVCLPLRKQKTKIFCVYTCMGTSIMTQFQETLPSYFSRHHLQSET
jgi:hypothetical protein